MKIHCPVQLVRVDVLMQLFKDATRYYILGRCTESEHLQKDTLVYHNVPG